MSVCCFAPSGAEESIKRWNRSSTRRYATNEDPVLDCLVNLSCLRFQSMFTSHSNVRHHCSSALWLSMVPHHSTCSRNMLHPWLINFFAACHVQYFVNITAVVVAAENVFRDYRTSGCRVIKVTQKLVLNSVWRQYQRVIIHLLCLLTLSKGRYKTPCEGVRVLEPLLELILLIYLW